jgi:predicted GNAT superfamily acetyltransferase
MKEKQNVMLSLPKHLARIVERHPNDASEMLRQAQHDVLFALFL